MNDKKMSSIDKINIISKKIGLDKNQEKTVINIESTEDPSKKLLTLKSGDWDGDEPWFAIDENDKIHTIVSIDTLLQIIKSLRKAQEENFNLKLEKTIWQNIPIDFQDVWVVAMNEIKKQLKISKDKKTVGIDTQKVIQDIKKKHPNLFLNLDMYLPPKTNEDMI